MNTTQLNKQNLRAIRADIDAALNAVATKYGIVLKTGRCTFTDAAATMKVEISTISDSGEVIDREMVNLMAHMSILGLTADHLKQTFRIGSKTFKLTGYSTSRYAKPFSLRCVEDSKNYVARESQVRFALGLPASSR